MNHEVMGVGGTYKGGPNQRSATVTNSIVWEGNQEGGMMNG